MSNWYYFIYSVSYPSSQGYGFSSGHVRMWELDCEESWAPKNWCSWSVVLEKTLESPLDCKEIQTAHSKVDQSWVFFGRTDAKAATPVLACVKLTHWKRLWCGEGLGAGGEKDDRGWDGWMASPTWWTWVWVNSRSWWWTGGLASCNSWCHKESDTTERLNWERQQDTIEEREGRNRYPVMRSSLFSTAKANKTPVLFGKSTRLAYDSMPIPALLWIIAATVLAIVQLLNRVWLCSLMDCSTSGFPVLHYLLAFAQIHVRWVSDAIQSSHPLSTPSPPALSLSQHQWFSSLHQVAKVVELQHQSFQWIFSWSPSGLTGLISLHRIFSSTTVWKHQFFSAQPSLWSNCHIHTWLLEKPLLRRPQFCDD